MQLLNFDNIVNEKYNPINESVKSFFLNAIQKVKGWFTGKHAWLKNLRKLKSQFDQSQLNRAGIEFFDYTEGGADFVTEKANAINEAETKNVRKGVPLEHPSQEVPNYSFKEMEETLDLHFTTLKDYPPFIWGAPGIGKTDVVKQLAQKHKCYLILINLSVFDPVDFIGLPSIEKGRTVYNLPEFFPTDNGPAVEGFPEGKGGIIFFDELNRASGPVLSASLQLFLDKKIHKYMLPSEWIIVAAGNRSVEAPEVNDLGAALSNRVKQYNLIPDTNSWADWALKQKDKEGKNKISPQFISFLLANKQYFHSYTGDPNTPWPSPRSWSAAAVAYKALVEKNPKRANDADFLKRQLASDVGMDAATEFINFLKLAEHFTDKDVEDVYKSPTKAKLPDTKRADITYAVICKIVFARREQVKSKEDYVKFIPEYLNFIKYSERLPVEFASMMIKMGRQQYPDVMKDKTVIAALEEWSDVFQKDLSKM